MKNPYLVRIEKALAILKWVTNDAAFKAPEQFAERSHTWLDKVKAATDILEGNDGTV